MYVVQSVALQLDKRLNVPLTSTVASVSQKFYQYLPLSGDIFCRRSRFAVVLVFHVVCLSLNVAFDKNHHWM